MPKRPSKADLKKRLDAKRHGISLAELKNRLKSDGDGEDWALPHIHVSRYTSNKLGDHSQEFPMSLDEVVRKEDEGESAVTVTTA